MKQSNAVITEDFSAILNNVENKVMNKLRVGTLARVLEVSDRLLTVKPIIMERINTPTAEKYIQLPEIHNVYCIEGQDISVGDYVICVHFDRGLDNFDLFNNKTGFIESKQNRHDLNDCVAIKIATEDVQPQYESTPLEIVFKIGTTYTYGGADSVTVPMKEHLDTDVTEWELTTSGKDIYVHFEGDLSFTNNDTKNTSINLYIDGQRAGARSVLLTNRNERTFFSTNRIYKLSAGKHKIQFIVSGNNTSSEQTMTCQALTDCYACIHEI